MHHLKPAVEELKKKDIEKSIFFLQHIQSKANAMQMTLWLHPREEILGLSLSHIEVQ